MDTDNVNHPPHYKQGTTETIDLIRAALGDEGFVTYCRGNVLKYIARAPYKGNQEEDLRKASWYAQAAAAITMAGLEGQEAAR